MHAAGGWTLIELISVCAVIGVLAAVAVPSFRELRMNARRTEAANTLLHGLYAARSAAIRSNSPAVLCKSKDGHRCDPDPADWSGGWLLFENADRDWPPTLDPDESIVLHQRGFDGITINGNRDVITYWPTAVAGTAASFVICDKRGSAAARAIVVSATGRPRLSDRDSDGKALSCR